MVEYIMARAGWEVKDVCTMGDWEARAQVGSKIKGEQRTTTIFKLEFDLLVASGDEEEKKI